MIRAQIERIFMKRQAYRRMFLDQDGNVRPDAEVVLADLKKFCRAVTPTIVVSPVQKTIDPMAMAMAEGRREVWNRLMAYLHLEDKIVLNLRDPNIDNQPGEF
jgi:hypothetical protein